MPHSSRAGVTPATKGVHSSKNEHGALVKVDLRKKAKQGPLSASLRSRNAYGHLTRELLREPAQTKRAPHTANPGSTSTLRTPLCGDTVWGKLQIYKLTLSKTNTENSPANLLTDGQYAIDVERKDPFYPVAQCTNIAQLENQCCGPKVNKTLESFWKEILLAWGFIILSHTPWSDSQNPCRYPTGWFIWSSSQLQQIQTRTGIQTRLRYWGKIPATSQHCCGNGLSCWMCS